MSIVASSPLGLAPPRAAAVAGVLFAVLMATSLTLIRIAIPSSREDVGTLLAKPARRNAVRLAVQLAPFAGIAFLWFINVIRSR